MMNKESSIICKHAGHSSFELRRVYDEPDLKGREVWVNICGKPSGLTYNRFLQRCLHCLGWFSSPWEALCVPCFRQENPPGTLYRGWRWAKRTCDTRWEAMRNLRKSLDIELDLPHTHLVGTRLTTNLQE